MHFLKTSAFVQRRVVHRITFGFDSDKKKMKKPREREKKDNPNRVLRFFCHITYVINMTIKNCRIVVQKE
jgi:hypothetical protein